MFYTASLLAVAFSVSILGERAGIRRWSAIIVGLIGVFIIASGLYSVHREASLARHQDRQEKATALRQ